MNNLRFANDMVLMSWDGEELQRIMKELENETFEVGLKINLKKAILISNQNRKLEIILDNNKILVKNSTIYLCQEIAFQKNLDRKFNRKRATAWKSIWSSRQIYKIKKSTHNKRKIFESSTSAVLTYGAQTWATIETENLLVCT